MSFCSKSFLSFYLHQQKIENNFLNIFLLPKENKKSVDENFGEEICF